MEHIRTLMEREIELFTLFGKHEQRLQTAIVERDWVGLDVIMPEIEQISRDIAKAENARRKAIRKMKAAMNVDADAPFMELLLALPESARESLTELFRAFQVAVLRVRSITGGIDSYVRAAVRTGSAVLGELFPHQKGTIYRRNGKHSPAHAGAMVLDHEM